MSDFALDEFLPYQLAVIAGRVSREFSSVYAERFGLTVPEWRVIVHIYNAGPVSVREIHARVDMDKSKVSRAASRLEAAGWITKDQNTDDRRLLKLDLTPQGREMMAELTPLATAFEGQLMERLGPEAATFRALLDRLLEETP